MQIKAWHIAELCCASTLILLMLLDVLASSGKAESSSQPAAASSQVGVDVGDTAPEFAFVSTNRETIRSSELSGQIVVITSAAVWCRSCVAEAFQLAAVYVKHRDDPVTFITIDIDPRNAIELINRSRKDNVTPWFYGQALDAEQVIDDYQLDRFEITYVIDQDGIIRYKDTQITSVEELEQALSLLL